MAGLFDSIGTDPVLAARIAEQQRRAAQTANVVGQFSDPWAKAGAAAGSLLGNIAGGYIAGKTGYESPEMQQAKRQASVIEALQGADLNTSAGLTEAAKAVRNMGDTATALRLAQRAGELRLAENALQRKQTREDEADTLARWNAQPASVQESVWSRDPKTAARMSGISDPKLIAQTQQDVQEQIAFKKAKLQKAAEDLKATKVVPSPTAGELKQAENYITKLESGGHWYDKANASDVQELTGYAAARAKKIQTDASQAGKEVPDYNTALATAWGQLKTEGVVTVAPSSWTGKPEFSVNVGNIASPSVPKDKAPEVPPKQAPDGNWYIPDPARPGKYLMVQPPK